MGEIPRRTGTWLIGAGAIGLMAALLGGCGATGEGRWSRFGLPEAASDRAPFIGDLWVGAWIASLVIGGLTWGLIGWAVVRYRRTHPQQLPRQSRYNLPMEILYTVVPFLIIGVLFFFTVRAQDGVNAKVGQPAHTVNVIGQKWSWTFNYMEPGGVVHEVGTIEKTPDLYLVAGETVRFNLTSADVIHSFWVPAFYYKLDVIPGKPNSFDLTPTKKGTFAGKCAELCGTYHSAMLFNVHVVSRDEFDRKLAELKSHGQTGEIKPPQGPSALATPEAHEGHATPSSQETQR